MKFKPFNPALFNSGLLAIAVIFLSSCSNSTTTTEPEGESGEGAQVPELVTLTLIHMNDLHANLVAHNEMFRIEGSDKLQVEKAGGILKIATKVKQIREANIENTILMNIGDTFHGGAEAMFTNGNAIVEAVNELNIDIGVPGNWDYAYGPIITNARFGNLTLEDVDRPNYPMLAANATYRIPPAFVANPIASGLIQNVFNYTAGDPFLPATQIIEKSGIKVGFIGLTSDIVEFMHPIMAFNIEFVDGVANYKSLVEELASNLRDDGVHLVVIMSELGLQKDWALANQLEEGAVDFVFSAHTHEVTEQPLISSSGALVVEAGNDSFLGQMQVTVENGVVTSSQWELHRLDGDVANDQDMQLIVDQLRAPMLADSPNLVIPTVTLGNAFLDDMMPTPVSPILYHSIEQEVGNTRLALDRRHSLENNFNSWFSERLKTDNLTDIAITSGFRFDSIVIPNSDAFDGNNSDNVDSEYLWQSETPEILDGKITVADAYRFFPAPFNIAQGNVSIARLKEIIESNLEAVYSTDVFAQKGGWVDGFAGIELTVDLTAPYGQRIKSIQINNMTLDDNDIISVTGCARPFDQQADSTICAYSGFSEVQNLINPGTGEAYVAADYFIDALDRSNISLDVDVIRTVITDESKLPQWPQSELFQPIEGAK